MGLGYFPLPLQDTSFDRLVERVREIAAQLDSRAPLCPMRRSPELALLVTPTDQESSCSGPASPYSREMARWTNLA